MSYEGLIERLRAATGPDRQTDWLIADATDHPSFATRFEHIWPPFGEGSVLDRGIPAYTASIDAALALAERLLPGWAVGFDRGPKTCIAFVDPNDYIDRITGARYVETAATAPLAILLATLTAKETDNAQ